MLVSIAKGLLYPFMSNLTPTTFGSPTIDAATEKITHMGCIYIDGRPAGAKTISAAGGGSISFMTGAVTFANGSTTVDIGIQDMSASGNPAQPDGTFDVKRTLTGGGGGLTTSAWNTVSMTGGTGTKSITHGQQIAVVWDMTALGGVDSVIVLPLSSTNSGIVWTHDQGSGSPGATAFSGTWSNSSATHPNVIITFDDGTLGMIDGGFFLKSVAYEQFSDSTNPDERGMIFQVPFNCKVDAFLASMALTSNTASDFTITLYSTPLGTPSSLGALTINAEAANVVPSGQTGYVFTLASEITLDKNTSYCLAVKATNTSNVGLHSHVLGSATYRALMPGGATVGKATRNNSTGAFTAESPAITNYGLAVRISAVDDGMGVNSPTYQLGI